MTKENTLTTEEAIKLGLQSPNWVKFDNFQFTPSIRIDSHGEKLPVRTDTLQDYDLITRSGERLRGQPTYASPFDSGMESGWKIKLENRIRTFSTYAIIAWKRVQLD